MLFLLDGTIGANVREFLERIYEDTPPCNIILYSEWLSHHSHECDDQHPKGIIYMRVMPEIALKRMQQTGNNSLTLEEIQRIYREKEELFIDGKNVPLELNNL